MKSADCTRRLWLPITLSVVLAACGGGGGGGGDSDGAPSSPPSQPNGKPAFTGQAEFTVDEGAVVHFTVEASDPDGDSLQLELLDTADADFFYQSASFEISSRKLFDFEDPEDADGDGVFELDLKVSDAVSFVTSRFNVTIRDRPGRGYYGEQGAAIILGSQQHDNVGNSFQPIGDIDGDGIGEVIIGVPNRRNEYDGIGTETGRTYLVSSAIFADAQAGMFVLPEDGADGVVLIDDRPTPNRPANGGVGFGFADLLDLDGDAIPEVAMSSRLLSEGSVAVVRGAVLRAAMASGHYVSLATLVADGNGMRLTGNSGGDAVGHAISSLDDLDGDGRNELIVCAPGVAVRDDFHSSTYVIFGSMIANHLEGQGLNPETAVANGRAVRLAGAEWPDSNCTAVADAGDFDGDGLADVMVAERRQSGSRYGRVHIVSGAAILAARDSASRIMLDELETVGRGVSVISYDLYNRFGADIARAGDFNGDGIDDVMFGAPDTLYDDDHRYGNHGAAYILFGTTEPFSASIILHQIAAKGYGVEFQGPEPGYELGESLAGAGDLNGDGFDDILVSAPSAPFPRPAQPTYSDSTGITYLLFGVAKVPGNTFLLAQPFEGVRVVGINPGSRFGDVLSRIEPAAELDADTVADFLLGAPNQPRCAEGVDEYLSGPGAVVAVSGQKLLDAYAGDGLVDIADVLPHTRVWTETACSKPGLDWLP